MAELNEWNRRPDVLDAERTLCRVPGHGVMVAVRDTHEVDVIRWRCPVCAEVQPVTEEQARIALGGRDLPVVAMGHNDDTARRARPVSTRAGLPLAHGLFGSGRHRVEHQREQYGLSDRDDDAASPRAVPGQGGGGNAP